MANAWKQDDPKWRAHDLTYAALETDDMVEALRLIEALRILLDESRPIRDRLDEIRPASGNNLVRGMGRASITTILQVVYPSTDGRLLTAAERCPKGRVNREGGCRC